MNVATRMSLSPEAPFLKVLPPPAPQLDLPALPRPQAMAEQRRLTALRQLQEAMALEESPRHWGINE